MPKKKSAYKALRQDATKTEKNRIVKKTIKDLRKKAEKFVEEKKRDEALGIYKQLQKAIDKASRAGHFMNENTAARYKSRLMQKINAIKKS